MAGTVKIAILAEAAKAKAEFADTGDAAKRSGAEIEQAYAGAGSKAAQEFGQVGDSARREFAGIGDDAKRGLQGVGDAAKNAGNDLEREIDRSTQQAGSSFERIGDQAKAGLGKIGGFAKEAGAALLGGLGIGVGMDIGGQLVDGIMSALGKADIRARLSAQLGLEGEDAARAGKIAGEVYSDNFGNSLADVSQAVKSVYQNIGEGTDQWAKDTVAAVLTVSDVFEQDLGGTTRAVGQMLRTGLAPDAKTALDILTAGFQAGADKAEDLLDTFNEYSTQFRKLGLDGQTAMGLISQGLQAGARDADLVADAIKEFTIRAIDGSKTTASAFKDLGLNAQQMQADLAGGGQKATDAFGLVLDKLREVKDPAEQARLAVALFGTQAEDLGAALFALDTGTAVQQLGNFEGAAQRVADTVGGTPLQKIEAFKRSLQEWTTGQLGAVVTEIDSLLQKVPPSVWDGIRSSIDALKDSLGQAGAAWLELAEAATGSSSGQEVLLKTLQVVRAALDAIVIAADGVTIAYQSAAAGVYALIAGYKLLSGDLAGAKEAWNQSKAAAEAAGAAAVKQGQDAIKLGQDWQTGGAQIQQANRDAAAAAVIAAKETGDAHDRGAQQAATAHTSAATTIKAQQTAIAGGAAGAATTVATSHKTAATQTSGYWQVVPGLIKGYFANTSLSSAGNNVMNSFLNAAKSVWDNQIAPWLSARAADIAKLKGPPAKDKVLLQEAGELVMGGFLTGLEAKYKAVVTSLTEFTDLLKELGVKLGLSLSDGVKQAEPSMLLTAQAVAKDVVTSMGKKLDTEKPGLILTAAAVAKGVTDAMGDKLTTEKPGLLVTAGNVAQGVVKALADSTVKNTPTATQAAANLGKEVFSALQREAQAQPFGSLGVNIVQAFATGINGASQNASAAITNVVSNALNAARAALGIASPSKPATEIGRQTGQGFVNGLLEQRAAVRAAAQELVDLPAAAAMESVSPQIDVTRPIGGIPVQGGPTVLELRSSGSRTDDLLLELLRRSIRARGGNVQIALMGR